MPKIYSSNWIVFARRRKCWQAASAARVTSSAASASAVPLCWRRGSPGSVGLMRATCGTAAGAIVAGTLSPGRGLPGLCPAASPGDASAYEHGSCLCPCPCLCHCPCPCLCPCPSPWPPCGRGCPRRGRGSTGPPRCPLQPRDAAVDVHVDPAAAVEAPGGLVQTSRKPRNLLVGRRQLDREVLDEPKGCRGRLRGMLGQ